jgi:hypothetical protein
MTSTKDYIRSKGDSEDLIYNIRSWWNRNYPDLEVRLWLESDISEAGNKMYYVRSNIVMGVPK